MFDNFSEHIVRLFSKAIFHIHKSSGSVHTNYECNEIVSLEAKVFCHRLISNMFILF